MLARPINTLQPPAGRRLETQRLVPLRTLLGDAKGALPLTESQLSALLDNALNEHVERIELVHVCGVQLNVDDASFQLKNGFIEAQAFLDMTPIAGETAVFRKTAERKVVHYTLGATVDNECISLQVERTTPTSVSVAVKAEPSPIWTYVDNIDVDKDTLEQLFVDLNSKEWRQNLDKLTKTWPCMRGVRMRHDHEGLHVVLPPSLVRGMLHGLASASGIDALWSSYRDETLPHHPWIADADVVLNVQDPRRAGRFGAISLKLPMHPLSAHVPGGRLELFLSACGCSVEMNSSSTFCGRCDTWRGQNDQRALFFEQYRRAGQRCLDRIQITVGCATGGKWSAKRSIRLSARSNPEMLPLVKALADAVEFSKRITCETSNLPSSLKFVQCVAALPEAPAVEESPLVKEATKLLREKRHAWKGRGKERKLVDGDGKGPRKTIEKRFGWLFPTATPH